MASCIDWLRQVRYFNVKDWLQMRSLQRLACAVPLIFLSYVAVAGEGAWGPWSSPSTPALVGAAFTNDDGGALLIACDKTKRLIGYVLREPRANWEKGSQIRVTTRADDGSQTGPSRGVAINSTSLAVGEEWSGPGYLNRFSASISGVPARVRLPSGAAAVVGSRLDRVSCRQGSNVVCGCCRSPGSGRVEARASLTLS